VALAASVYVARAVLSGTAEGSPSVSVMAGLDATIVGGLGFVAGFFSPMLGLFTTGPAGVVIGAIAGALYAKRRSGARRSRCYISSMAGIFGIASFL